MWNVYKNQISDTSSFSVTAHSIALEQEMVRCIILLACISPSGLIAMFLTHVYVNIWPPAAKHATTCQVLHIPQCGKSHYAFLVKVCRTASSCKWTSVLWSDFFKGREKIAEKVASSISSLVFFCNILCCMLNMWNIYLVVIGTNIVKFYKLIIDKKQHCAALFVHLCRTLLIQLIWIFCEIRYSPLMILMILL